MPDLAKLLAKNLAKYGKPIGVKPCTLTKVTPGTRTSNSQAGGTNPTEASYAATGWIESYNDHQIDGTLVRRGDRRISLLGASIAGGVVPSPNDKITIADPSGVVNTYRIVPDGVTSDATGAIYTCQTRL